MCECVHGIMIINMLIAKSNFNGKRSAVFTPFISLIGGLREGFSEFTIHELMFH